MKRQLKAILIAAPIVVLLIAAAVVIKLVLPKGETETEIPIVSHPVIQESPQTLTKIEISNTTGSFVIEKDENGSLGIEEYTPYPQNNANYLLLQNGLSSFISSAKIEGTKDLDVYGLKNPSAKAKVYFSTGLEYTLYIGNEATYAAEKSRYVKIEGDDNVYVMISEVAEIITCPKHDFLSLVVTNIDYQNMVETFSKIEISGKDTPSISIVPGTYTYDGVTYVDELKIDYPYDIFVSSEKSTTVFSTVLNIHASGIEVLGYKNADLSKYGFSDPTTICRLSLKDGTKTTIYLGNKSEEGYYYLLTDQYPIIYRVDSHYAEVLKNLSPSSIMSEFVTLPPIGLVKQMKIEFEGKKYIYDISSDPSDAQYLEVKLNSEAVSAEDFRAFYAEALRYYVTDITDIPKGDRYLKIEYVYKDSSKGSDVMEFYDIGEYKYAVVKNSAAAYITQRGYVQNITNTFKKLLAGETIAKQN